MNRSLSPVPRAISMSYILNNLISLNNVNYLIRYKVCNDKRRTSITATVRLIKFKSAVFYRL